MKKIILFVGIFSSVMLSSCGDKTPSKPSSNDSTPTQVESTEQTTSKGASPSGVENGGGYVDSYSWGELH